MALTAVNMKAIRQELGLSQEKFAALLGFSSFQIINMKENGRRSITQQDIIIISLRWPELAAKFITQ